MIRKIENHNRPFEGAAATDAHDLEAEGHVMVRSVFSADEIGRLRDDVADVFERYPPDIRAGCQSPERAAMFRYQMFNRSALCQEAIGQRRILDIVEPLLGDDCHVIACTAWRNPADRMSAPRGQQWHVDGGPHIVRPEGTRWPTEIPYPVFVIAAQIYLEDCKIGDGPTAAIPGSHRSGCLPPHEKMWDLDLEYEGRRGVAHVANAGDVGFVVSDTWHRRMPPNDECTGRFFLQTNFGRREIAQRVLPAEEMNPTTEESRARAQSLRQRQLIGLHEPGFYDG